MDEDGQNSTDNEDFTTNANNNLPVLEKLRKQSQPAIQRKALPVTSVLEDTGKYQDSNGYESIPFEDDPTAKPRPSATLSLGTKTRKRAQLQVQGMTKVVLASLQKKADANVPSPQTKKPQKAAPPCKKPQKAATPHKNPWKAAKSGRAPI
ncbi:hypothetical protein BKA83DRAFT_4128551 [Pisolithus microcarpus]|nr:hypothetical protein BKA83DRAFT_4128551 [Pisolithus microcarpus]